MLESTVDCFARASIVTGAGGAIAGFAGAGVAGHGSITVCANDGAVNTPNANTNSSTRSVITDNTDPLLRAIDLNEELA
jgi:hypothetical protein